MNLYKALMASSFDIPEDVKYLSTGLTVLNYALSGNYKYGLRTGSSVIISGGANSGRTTLGLTFLAEASINPLFDSYKLVYFDTEGKSVDVHSYLGTKAGERIFLGAVNSIDAFWHYCATAKNRIIVLDSLDGLMVGENTWKTNNACAKGVFDCVRKNNSIVVITIQGKKINGKKVTVGGYSPIFYSDVLLRLDFKGEIRLLKGRKEVSIGTNTSITPLKSAFSGVSIIECPAPIIVGYGYDNARSLLTHFIKTGKVIERDGIYTFPLFDVEYDYDSMLKYIRDNELKLSYQFKELVT